MRNDWSPAEEAFPYMTNDSESSRFVNCRLLLSSHFTVGAADITSGRGECKTKLFVHELNELHALWLNAAVQSDSQFSSTNRSMNKFVRHVHHEYIMSTSGKLRLIIVIFQLNNTHLSYQENFYVFI